MPNKITLSTVFALAKVTSEFKSYMKRLEGTSKIVYTTPKIQGKKYLTMKRKGESEKDYYYYMERLGVDSVAFILYDSTRDKPYGVLSQYSTSTSEFVNGAYTGSLDKPHLSLMETLIEEISEESEYEVGEDRINHVGYMTVNSMTSEKVNLYLVDVKGLEKVGTNPENLWEENTEHIWYDYDSLVKVCEWKAVMIALRAIHGLEA